MSKYQPFSPYDQEGLQAVPAVSHLEVVQQYRQPLLPRPSFSPGPASPFQTHWDEPVPERPARVTGNKSNRNSYFPNGLHPGQDTPPILRGPRKVTMLLGFLLALAIIAVLVLGVLLGAKSK